MSLKENNLLKDDSELIIVNNDSREKLENILGDFKRVKLINHKKNVGFGSGMNLGAKNSNGKFLWFLNPDCEFIEGNIEDVLHQLEKTKGIVGSKLVDEKGNTQQWSAGRESDLLEIILNNLGIKRSKRIWSSSNKMECDWVSGTSFFIGEKLFKELGGFDEGFFMYFEDMDICKRARDIQRRVTFFPHFVIKHLNGRSYSKKALQKKHFYDSQDYYFRKNNKKSAFLLKFLRKIAFK